MTRTGIGIILVCIATLGCVIADIEARAQGAAGAEGAAEEARQRQVMERFLALLEQNPRRGTALDRVYGYHVERGSLEELIKSYQQRTAADAKDGTAWLLLGLLEAQRGHDALAVAALKQAEAARPDDPLASFYLGEALVLVGQPDTAAQAFERAIARKPGRADLLTIFQALGRVHQRAYHTAQALEVWNRLEALFPDDLRVQEQIAATLAEENEPAKALPRYEALAKKATDRYRKTQFRIEAAELKVRLNRAKEALADFESLLGQLNPESWLYRDVRRRIEEVFLRNDDQSGLAAYYEGWLKQSPEDVDAMARLGRALSILGRTEEARGWLEKAVKLAPSRRQLRLALVEQFLHEKRFAEAAAQYEAMARSEPNDPDVVREWGRLLLRDTDRPEAERKQAAATVWRTLTTARPNDAPTAALVAELFRQAGMPDDAIALYQRAIALAPEASQYYEYLGEFYHDRKNPEAARATWAKIAEGKNHTAQNLGRLAEVLARFGYVKEALDPSAEACRLAPDEFGLQIKRAEWLAQLKQHDDALKQLDAAARAADGPEQADAVLALQIKTYRASDRLKTQIAALRAELNAGRDASAERWRRLARYYDADRQRPEATAAIGKAVALDDKSVPCWATYARIHEESGDVGGAVVAYRKLAGLDRRKVTEYLTRVAELEAQLGRRDSALQAGREVLAAAPGKPESYQFFANLCTQLGQVDEGLETLRRALRVNPNDIEALTTLAGELAAQFRTAEAIELYWRAFEKTPELDSRLAVVTHLTELYLQRNQFDRLIARLEREQHDPKQSREMTICLAQAYQSSEDYGAARSELERLLATSPRDTILLRQLSNLAETDGDPAAAAKYQRALNEIAPSDDGTVRLAQLCLQAGELSEAEATWAQLAVGDKEPHRILRSVDSLLDADKALTALAVITRFVHEHPDSWDGLYREGVALTLLDRYDEARRRFRTLLSLPIDENAESALVKAARKSQPGRSAGGSPNAPTSGSKQEQRLQLNAFAAWSVRQAANLDEAKERHVYVNGLPTPGWAPSDFGQVRVAALGWMVRIGRKQGTLNSRFEEFFEAKDRDPHDAQALWDWYYLNVLLDNGPGIYDAALALSRQIGDEPAVLNVYLSALPGRVARSGEPAEEPADDEAAEKPDNTPPLPPAELEYMLKCYRKFVAAQHAWFDSSTALAVMAELKRAGRTDEVDRIYKELAAQEDWGALDCALDVAVNRRDVDTVVAILDRWAGKNANPAAARIRATALRMGVGVDLFHGALIKLMASCEQKEAYADIIKLFDHYFDAYAQSEMVALRLRAHQAGGSGQPASVTLVLPGGKSSQFVEITYPTPNGYFDEAGIETLRAVFEIFRRSDRLPELTAHVRQRSENAPAKARLLPLLALSYVQWWNDERAESIRLLTQAVELAQGDTELRMTLAEIRVEQADHAEALAVLDGIDAVDQQVVRRREVMALRLAVLAGNVPRARLAAERLFNLRLNTSLQIQLAAQMHQLGMHEMAEAVLVRARHRAGNQQEVLVELMRQHQQQNQMDVAVQIARQILRRGPDQRFRHFPGMDDRARREAIEVLARSGQLQQLIARVEAQLKKSPDSVQLLETLAEYHRAADEPDKARAVVDRIVKRRADDPKLRVKIGVELQQAGDHAGAIEHFKAALLQDPSRFAFHFWQMRESFRAADKDDDLIGILESIDFKKIGHHQGVQMVVHQLLLDEKTRNRAMGLFDKLWQAFPNERLRLLGSAYGDDFWRQPRMYDYLRTAIIPAPEQRRVTRWAGVDGGALVFRGNVSLTNRLLDAADTQHQLDALAGELASAVQRLPEWSAGSALIALVKLREGRVDEAKQELETLLAKEPKKEPMPAAFRLVIGRMVENRQPLEPIASRLYESAYKQGYEHGFGNYEEHPVHRLVALYRKVGRTAEARELLLTLARRPKENASSAGRIVDDDRASLLIGIGQDLLDLGLPADAIPLYNEVLSNSDMPRMAGQILGSVFIVRPLRAGISRALASLNDTTLAPTLRDLLKGGQEPGSPAIDPVWLVNPRELDRATLISFTAAVLRAASRQPELAAEMKTALAALAAKAPGDFSVLAAQALVASFDDTPKALETAAQSLLERAAKAPLEPLAPDGHLSARQRAEAAQRLGVWVVARACWERAETRALGDRLATIALEAAQRQADSLLPLALLREWGQTEYDRGETARAELTWGRMLDQALGKGAPAPDSKAPATVAVTLERFTVAAQIARLAARHGMVALSLRAVRESLGGGPPMIPLPIDEPNGPTVAIVQIDDETGKTEPFRVVEEHLADLDAEWRRHKADPVAVYEALRTAVLPASRPAEILLYARPLKQTHPQPRSVAGQLVRWAVAAERVDDLKQQIAARRGRPMAVLSADVLDAQIGLATHNDTLQRAALEALEARLANDSLATTAEMVCLAALPAAADPHVARAALPLLDRAANNLTDKDVRESVRLAVARGYFAIGDAGEGRKHLQAFKNLLLRSTPTFPRDYTLTTRKQHHQKVATEFLRAGLWVDALEALGEFADVPSGSVGELQVGIELTTLLRALAKEPAKARYQRLQAWTMPAPNRVSVRLLATFVSPDTPPGVFGDVPAPLGDESIMSTAGMLIDAARECGTLDALTRQAQGLTDKKVENAETLLILAQIAQGLGTLTKPRLEARDDAIRNLEKTQPKLRTVSRSDVLLAHAALRDPVLATDIGPRLAASVIGRAKAVGNGHVVADLKRCLARQQAMRAGGSATVCSPEPGLAHWHTAAIVSAAQHASGASPAWWVESEGHLKHIAGPGDDLVLFDIPLAGSFEFSIDAWNANWAQGHAGYAGLVLQANDAKSYSEIYPVGRPEHIALPSPFVVNGAFNRLTVRVEPGEVRYLVNGHLFYRDTDPSPTAPWLTLRCSRDAESTFRNPRITGNPAIPRSVSPTHGDRLEGWVSSFFDQSQPPRRSLRDGDLQREAIASETVYERFDWVARDGEIRCRKVETSEDRATVQSRLCYMRPLREGDALSYEFYYEPGELMAHPALDRLAFLLEPDGTRLHWITDGPDDPTGLKLDNVVDDAAIRRGPDHLPLKPHEWNTAEVRIDGAATVIVLNGVEVARRPLEPSNTRQFGFFHFRNRTGVQVRHVVLTGNWPQMWPADLMARDADERPTPGDRLARHRLVGEEAFAESAALVLKTARILAAEPRYDYLRQWVLPRDDKPDFRLAVIYTPTDAAPPVASPSIEPPDNLAENRLHTGGALDAPALELVSVARQLGKLDELAELVTSNHASTKRIVRERIAMLALIHIAQHRDDAAQADLQELVTLVKARPKGDTSPVWQRAPEQLAQWASLGRAALRETSRQLLFAQSQHWNDLVGQGQWIAGRDLWGRALLYAFRRDELLNTPPAARDAMDVAVRMPLWSRVEHASAYSRASGCAVPRWWVDGGILHHGQGHREDYLYLNVPLRGDFEVNCEIRDFGPNQMQLAYGALMTATRWDRKAVEITEHGKPGRELTLDPPLEDAKEWYPLRLVVNNHRYTVFIQGRKIFEAPLPDQPDPWLAIHQRCDGTSGLRGLKITGDPTVPRSVSLSAQSDLTGWLADYYEERLGGDAPSWTRKGDEMVGPNFGSDEPPALNQWGNEDLSRLPTTARLGSKQESVLQYHRPLLEDGTLDYEFFYVPGKTLVHPALDRLALILDTSGVKVHWLTDGKYDRTGLAPDNLADEPRNRRGPSSLPLEPNAWNRVTVTLHGNVVGLALNGVLVYERTLEPTNGRQFGFFHYADETEARVRNVLYRGQWPGTVPADPLGTEPAATGR